jgi:hypothetical protein
MSEFIQKTAERAAKTFIQFYLGSWLFLSGEAADFEHLFTMENVEAGIVGIALSVATSIGTKGIGPNKESPSVV